MYATLADILEQVDQETLIALTDDALAGAVDESVVERAIANGDAVIDSACRDRYDIPFSAPVPDLVRLYSVDLAVYNLYSRRPQVEMPEVIGERHQYVLDRLRLVEQGKAGMGVAVNGTEGTESHGALVSGNDRIFTRGTMRNL